MKTSIKVKINGVLAAMAFVTLCVTARADLSSISNSATISSWNQVNGQNPFYTSLTSANLTGFTSQGQPGAASGATYTVLSETFTITNGAGALAIGNTNYTLSGIAIIGGDQPTNSSLHLFDVTTTLTSNNGSTLNGSGATYDFVTNGDLLGDGNGLALTNTFGGTDQILYSLTSGPNTQDRVVLGFGHTYAFEIWTPTGSGFVWSRNSTADSGGQAMGSGNASLAVARETITSLGLAGGAPRTFTLALYGFATNAVPSVNVDTNELPVTNYVIDAFNSFGYGPANPYVGANDYNTGGLINVWTNDYGSAWVTNTWDPTNDAQDNPNSGSMEILAGFSDGGQFVVWDQADGINPPLNALTNGINSFQCDVQFAASSPTTINSGTSVTNYGHLQFGLAYNNAANQDFFGDIEIPVGTTNWVHVNIPLNPLTDTNLAAINDVLIKIDGGWYSDSPLNGTTKLLVDNVKFQGPIAYVYVPPPVPTLAIQKASPGLRIFAGSTVDTYDRTELATVDQSQSWIGGTYPVSYSFKLLDYPANIGQTMIFLVPVNSVPGGSGSMYNNEYVEYQATNALWLNVAPDGTNGVTGTVEWKTNLPNSNPNQTALMITNSTAVGTWTLTFTSQSGGTLTAPGASPVAFSIPDSNIATDFANSLVAYFGVQPNSTAGEGEYEDWASISVTGVAGVNENENFTTEASISSEWETNTLTTALNSSVELATTNTPYWVYWTLPANGYGLAVATNLTTAPWHLPEYYNDFGDGNTIPGTAAQGNNEWVLVPLTCLPTVDGNMQNGQALSRNAFFKLFNPPLSN